MGIQALLQKFSGRNAPITIYRYKRGTYVGGVFHSEIDRIFTLWGTVMPIQFDTDTPDILISPGNHVRTTNMLKIFTTDAIYIDDPLTGQKADRLQVDGIMYEVRASALYSHTSLGHYESICVRASDQ